MTEKKTQVPRRVLRAFPQVTKVVESRKAVLITVRAEDCKNSTAGEPDACALAVAAKRQYKVQGAFIGLTVSYLIRGKTAIRFETPDTVQREVVSFDRNKDFAPGEYHLAGVRPSARRKAVRTQPQKPGSRSKGHRIVHKETVRVRNVR